MGDPPVATKNGPGDWLAASSALVVIVCIPALVIVNGTPPPDPPPPTKVVAAKVWRETGWAGLDPTQFYLVADDKTVCRVDMPTYGVTKPGDVVACEWRTW